MERSVRMAASNPLGGSMKKDLAPAQLDPASHTECLEFIRAIWTDLSQTEQQQFKDLLG